MMPILSTENYKINLPVIVWTLFCINSERSKKYSINEEGGKNYG